jgi:hypothetical protein
VDIALVRARDGDRCARDGDARELQVHHRVPRGQGGRDYAENLVTLCVLCHRWAHAHPHEAREGGWLLRSMDNPGIIPVKHFSWPLGLVLLGHDLDFIIWTDELAAEIEARG